jgi:hypothetical protein
MATLLDQLLAYAHPTSVLATFFFGATSNRKRMQTNPRTLEELKEAIKQVIG